MGLDITAYSNLRPVGRWQHTDDYLDDETKIHAFAYVGFERALDGLEGVDVRWNPGGQECVGDWAYEPTEDTEIFEFRAGSYHGYGFFRERLALFACGHTIQEVWADPNPDIPFVDLLNFADNEGVIGPIAAARLLTDFTSMRDLWIEVTTTDVEDADFYQAAYDNWTKAAELATQDGLIRFH